MHIYLIRHAHAEDGADDAARPLSRKGREQVRHMGRFLRETSEVEVAEFWHSPLVRSRDTAVLLAKHSKVRVKFKEVSGLEHRDDPEVMARKLGDARHPVAVVAHDPLLSALATLMVVGRAEPPRFKLKKGAVLRLDRMSGGWTVRWQVSPDLL